MNRKQRRSADKLGIDVARPRGTIIGETIRDKNHKHLMRQGSIVLCERCGMSRYVGTPLKPHEALQFGLTHGECPGGDETVQRLLGVMFQVWAKGHDTILRTAIGNKCRVDGCEMSDVGVIIAHAGHTSVPQKARVQARTDWCPWVQNRAVMLETLRSIDMGKIADMIARGEFRGAVPLVFMFDGAARLYGVDPSNLRSAPDLDLIPTEVKTERDRAKAIGILPD